MSKAVNTIRGRLRELRMTGPLLWLILGILVPVVLATSVGILLLVLGESASDVVLGVLVLCLAAAAVGSAIVLVVMLGRRARLVRIQGDLVGNVSHELKTPLASIRLYAQTLQMLPPDADAQVRQRCIDSIVRETQWLETVVERFLNWRSASKDRMPLELRLAPLEPAVSEAFDRFHSMLHRDETGLRLNVVSKRPVLHDPTAIASIVLNLLTNAYKFSHEPRTIVLSVTDTPSTVEIAVKDNGIGIAPRHLKRIFEPFERAVPAGEGISGAGLGLAIVAHLAQLHSGSVSVESDLGQGSVFRVTLPAREAENT